MVTQPILGDPMPSFLPNFTLHFVGREYPYGMPTIMMSTLQTNATMYVDNAITIASSLNSYLASGFAISNHIRMKQPQGELWYIPQVMSFLTTSSLQSMRQQMDENNHDMVNSSHNKLALCLILWFNVGSNKISGMSNISNDAQIPSLSNIIISDFKYFYIKIIWCARRFIMKVIIFLLRSSPHSEIDPKIFSSQI